MHERTRWLVAALALCAAHPALAETPRGTLYVKARNTRLMASASPTANVKAVLQPGQKVTWLGPDPKNKQWHQVEVDKKTTGVVFQSNLSTKPPDLGLVAKDGPSAADLRGIANAGAAVRGLSDGAKKYGLEKGKKEPSYTEAVAQVEELEKLALKITPQDLAEHAEQAHLFPVVGPTAAVSAKATPKKGGKR
jgi:uncharacterized protein YgiM (DUF1202 family)